MCILNRVDLEEILTEVSEGVACLEVLQTQLLAVNHSIKEVDSEAAVYQVQLPTLALRHKLSTKYDDKF